MKRFYYLAKVKSTNDLAVSLAEKGDPCDTVVIASSQTGGRGRGRNLWHSPLGGIYLSYLLRAEVSPAQIYGAPLVAAQAVISALKKETSLSPKIQLPNDIYLNDKKLGGILVENRLRGEKLDFMVIGLGINVNLKKADFPPELKEKATSILIETGKEFQLSVLINEIVCELSSHFLLFFKAGFSAFLPRIKQNCLTLGKKVKLKTLSGELEGKALDISTEGKLVLEKNNGELTLLSAFEQLVWL